MKVFLLSTVGSCEDPFWMNQRSSTHALGALQQRHVGQRMGFDLFTTNNLRAVA